MDAGVYSTTGGLWVWRCPAGHTSRRHYRGYSEAGEAYDAHQARCGQ